MDPSSSRVASGPPSPKRWGKRSGTWRGFGAPPGKGGRREAVGRGGPESPRCVGERLRRGCGSSEWTGARRARESAGDLWDVRAAKAGTHAQEPPALWEKERGPASPLYSPSLFRTQRDPLGESRIEWSFQEFPGRGGKTRQAEIARRHSVSPPPSLPPGEAGGKTESRPSL